MNITINTEKAIIYGENGSINYYINDCGGLEITHTECNGLTDDEFEEAQFELS